MTKFLPLFLLFLLIACNSKNQVTTYKAGPIKYAKNFKLIQRKDYTELIIISPQTKKVEATYALVKENSNAQIPNNSIRVDVPIKNIAAYSTTFIGMISTLDETESIKATTASKYIYNKKLNKYIGQKKVLTTDFDGSESPSALLKKEITLLVYSGFGDPYPNQDKLVQLGITCMANYDWEERHPLGKAEWIKLYGALYDKQEEADAHFNKISSRYFELKKQIAEKNTTKSVLKEKVIVGGMVGDAWIASAGESYLVGIMNDSGLDYIYKNSKGTGSNMYTLSEIIRNEAICTRWINAEAKDMDELLRLNPKFKNLHTVQLKQVYSYMNKSNYFWEYSSLHPEWLLEDFAMIGGSIPMKNLHFYQQLK